MFRGLIGNKVIDVRFRHNIECRTTSCLVSYEAPVGIVGAVGVAKCSEKDNFCRATGRKVALTRALGAINLSKEERRLVWNTYLSRAKNA